MPDRAPPHQPLPHPQVVAVTGGKGGVGKTSVAANMAVSMARHGRRVMLLDADLGLSNVDVQLGLLPPYTLAHVLRGERELADIVMPGPFGLQVVPSASGNRLLSQIGRLESYGLINEFSRLTAPLDALVIDTAAGVHDSVLTFCGAAQQVLIVLCDEPASITDAYATIKLLNRENRVARFLVVVNKANSERHGRDVFDRLNRVTHRFLDVQLELLSVVPLCDHLGRSIRQQRAVVEAYPRSRSATAIDKLARKFERLRKPVGPSGACEFFVERLVEHSLTSEMSVV